MPLKGEPTMNTLSVIITPDCEELLSHMPRGRDWSIISEDYKKNGSGTVKIGYNHNGLESESELTAAEEQALNTNRSVIAYWTT
jgi:hypothetical protein